jgi:hypothetical protein
MRSHQLELGRLKFRLRILSEASLEVPFLLMRTCPRFWENSRAYKFCSERPSKIYICKAPCCAAVRDNIWSPWKKEIQCWQLQNIPLYNFSSVKGLRLGKRPDQLVVLKPYRLSRLQRATMQKETIRTMEHVTSSKRSVVILSTSSRNFKS